MKAITMRRAARTPELGSFPKQNELGNGSKRKLEAELTSSPKQRPSKRKQVKRGAPPMMNNDYCSVCGLYGRFICCDACPKSFHFTCVDPPMDIVDVERMEDDWYCRECEYRRRHPEEPKEKKSRDTQMPSSQRPATTRIAALFDALNKDIISHNPTTYRPPTEIVHYFKGVSMGETGQYIDSSAIKHPRKKAGAAVDRRLKDKDGNFMYCFRCRKTALRKSLLSCDYCPLHWHMDCLDPPMVYPPSSTRKWMCPNHPDHIMPRIRQVRNPDIIDDVHATPNNGIVTIIDDESSFYDEDEDDDDSDLKEQNAQPSTPSDPEDEANAVIKYSNVVYRLPASSVKLDFLSHAASLREKQRIHEMDADPTREELRVWLEGLSCFQKQIARYVEKDLASSISEESGLHMLARAASL
ncbi:hypothetical protein BX666DRAFT_2000071 [Dichotomocladium elegans]|nr:hypothetical protein BX666DRAFT_2000071 [Dichotomocladium elegans]